MAELGLEWDGVTGFTLLGRGTAIRRTDGRVPATDHRFIVGRGKRLLTAPTELLDGVAEALRDASTRYSLLLITKGDLFDQETKLAQSGLGDLFAGVEILSDKTAGTYASLLKRRGIEPAEFVMVGNSLRSDVAPVVEVGARAVHIPYHVTWSHEHLPDGVLPPSGWYRLNGLSELGALLESIDQPPA